MTHRARVDAAINHQEADRSENSRWVVHLPSDAV